MVLKFHTNMTKGSKLKARRFLGLVLTFVEVTGEKLVGRELLAPHPILNRVKVYESQET